MPDKLLYQSEAERLVPERGIDIVEPEVPFSVFLGTSGIQGTVPWTLAELYFSGGLQRLYTSTCTILQKTINGFLCLLTVVLKSKTNQLNFE